MTISPSVKDIDLSQQEQSSGYKLSSTSATTNQYLHEPSDEGFDSFASVSLDGIEKKDSGTWPVLKMSQAARRVGSCRVCDNTSNSRFGGLRRRWGISRRCYIVESTQAPGGKC